MKKFQKQALTFIFVLFAALFAANAETLGDDIFENQKVEDGDFYKINKEPSKKEIEDENSKFFESVKQKKLDMLRKIEKERQKLESSKKSLSSATEKRKQVLEKNKARLKSQLSKKAEQEKPEEKQEAEAKKNQQSKSEKKEKNLTIAESEEEMDCVINLRKKFIDFGMGCKGIEYVWGGKTPKPGFDCSGFVSYTARQSLGIDIKGNAQDIYNQATPVSLGEALPGDLIFFKGSSDSRITHVGIYLGKNPGENDFGKQNLFLNAASAGPRTGVIISGLNENYWKKTFYGCGRIIPEI